LIAGLSNCQIEINMQNPRLAGRYAKALLDLSVEQNNLEITLKDMQLLDSICKQSTDFCIMLRSPVIKGDKKVSVINAVVGDVLSDLTKKFLHLLMTKSRELNLPEIAVAFMEQYNELKHIKIVNLTTAVAMDETTRAMLLGKIGGFMAGNSVELKEKVDESLIGGFVLEVDGSLFDASVKKKLSDIRSNIVDYSYVSKM